MRLYKIALLSFVLGLSACTKNDLPDFVSGRFDISFDSQLPALDGSDYETRTSLDYVVRLTWTEGDEISVVNMSTGMTMIGNLRADRTSSITTFSGTLTGTASATDQLVFIYPCQNYTREERFSTLTMNGLFENQDGSNPADVPFVATARTTLSDLQVSAKPLDFQFRMSFFQLNLLDLPPSSQIDHVVISGLNSAVTFSRNGNNVTYLYSDPDVITLSPQSQSTNASGNRTVYFSCPPQTSVEDGDREICVWLGEDAYVAPFPSDQILMAKNYILNRSVFEKTASSGVGNTD